jgi:hypothetical protein
MEHDFRIDVDSGVEPDLLFVLELDQFFVDSDPLRSTPQRVREVANEAVDPLKDRLMRAGNAEQLQHSRRFP